MSERIAEESLPGPVIFFDGVCNLCAFVVQFVSVRDRGRFFFASLQSPLGERLFGEGHAPQTIYVVEDGQVSRESTAALRIAKHLKMPWRLFSVLTVLPRPLLDTIYRFIAKNRYRWFGRKDACGLPTPELSRRFLR
jgi:predicted DCC family thiol-disulfide oxidoreductase YuxK